MSKRIYLFDFDGTLTSRDTLIEFIAYACGRRRLLLTLALYAPLLILMKLRLYPNYKAKQRVFAHLFAQMPLSRFNELCYGFAAQGCHLLRQEAVDYIDRECRGAEAVAIVSASIDNWVRPFADMYLGKADGVPPVTVIGTQVETADGVLTGRFATPNCYGAEKVRRVLAEYPDLAGNRSSYIVEAYGDSRGDRELLAIANVAYYKGKAINSQQASD